MSRSCGSNDNSGGDGCGGSSYREAVVTDCSSSNSSSSSDGGGGGGGFGGGGGNSSGSGSSSSSSRRKSSSNEDDVSDNITNIESNNTRFSTDSLRLKLIPTRTLTSTQNSTRSPFVIPQTFVTYSEREFRHLF